MVSTSNQSVPESWPLITGGNQEFGSWSHYMWDFADFEKMLVFQDINGDLRVNYWSLKQHKMGYHETLVGFSGDLMDVIGIYHETIMKHWLDFHHETWTSQGDNETNTMVRMGLNQ